MEHKPKDNAKFKVMCECCKFEFVASCGKVPKNVKLGKSIKQVSSQNRVIQREHNLIKNNREQIRELSVYEEYNQLLGVCPNCGYNQEILHYPTGNTEERIKEFWVEVWSGNWDM